jgi:hypothetical protein
MVKERDFYFDKLRAIEIFIQDYQESGKVNECTASVLRIMYATQDGFVTSDEEALAAVLQQTASLIGPEAAAATASAEHYMQRRSSFTAGTLTAATDDAVADAVDNNITTSKTDSARSDLTDDILDSVGTITISATGKVLAGGTTATAAPSIGNKSSAGRGQVQRRNSRTGSLEPNGSAALTAATAAVAATGV